MRAAELVSQIVASGGSLWFDGERVRGRNIPRRLAEQVKATPQGEMLLALLAPDGYNRQERAGIMEHDGGLPRAVAERLAGIRPAETPETVESYPSTTQPPSVRPERDMGPSRVSCGTCHAYRIAAEGWERPRSGLSTHPAPMPGVSRHLGRKFPVYKKAISSRVHARARDSPAKAPDLP
jgi:hypothetical protein